jgi:uncharacterized protein YmfQ (DUF2313 family)
MIIISTSTQRVVTLTGPVTWYDTDFWVDTEFWMENDSPVSLGISATLVGGGYSRSFPTGTGMYKLLPPGTAWPPEYEPSLLKDFIYGLSISVDRMNKAGKENLDLILPGDTGKYLQDWERFLGLPKCPDISQNLQQRASSVLAMWNISPYSNADFFVELGNTFGYTITVTNGTRGGWGMGLAKQDPNDFVSTKTKLSPTTDLQVTFKMAAHGVIAGGFSDTSGNEYLLIHHNMTENRLECGVGNPTSGTLIEFPYEDNEIVTVRVKATGEVYRNGTLMGTCVAPIAGTETQDWLGLYNIDANGNPWVCNDGTIYDVVIDGKHLLPGGASYFYEEGNESNTYPAVEYTGGVPSPTPADLTVVHDAQRGDPRDIFKIFIGVSNPTNPIYFSAGASGAGDRLIEYDFGPIECLINFFRPAHSYVIYEFTYPDEVPVDPAMTVTAVLQSGTYVPN